MSLLSKLTLRRTLIALGAVVAVSAAVAEPAAADRGRRWHSRGPRVGVYVGLPPVVLVAGRPAPYYDPYGYDRRYDPRERAYEHGYEEGYDDGYEDRGREEWHRRRAYHHRHHYDCHH
jgi:hypothetical protein